MKEFILQNHTDLLKEVQNIAYEWRPDEEGVLEPEEQQELEEALEATPIEQMHFIQVLSYLVSFCWEWVPDQDYDEEEVDEQKNTLQEAETLLEELKKQA